MSAEPGLTGVTRALACLALEHGDEDRCPSSDEELAQALIQEVRRLRQRCGIEPDRSAQETSLSEAMTEVAIAELPDEEQPGAILEMLWEGGWTLAPLAPNRTA